MYKKVLTAIVCLFILLLSCYSVFADTSPFKFDTKTGTILKYTGKASKVTVPKTINGVAVKSIGARAFESQKKLKSLVLPSTLTSINDRAFKDCKSLESINVPESLMKVSGTAFSGCSKLDKWYVDMLSEMAMKNSDPTSVFGFDAKTGTINAYTGKGGDVVIPEYIKKVKVVKIAQTAFADNQLITKITMPDTVVVLEQQAFIRCYNLKSIKLSNAIKTLELQTFYADRNLVEVILPNSLERMELQAFCGCEALTQIQLPSNLNYIGDFCFQNCKSLVSIDLPESVFEIRMPFIGCSALKSIYFNEEMGFGTNAPFSENSQITIYAPPAFKDYYEKLAKMWGVSFQEK